MAARSGEPARLFLAVWPGPAIQRALHAVALHACRECGGRAVAQRNIHLTLVFLGNVEKSRRPRVEAVAAGAAGAGCDLVVERLEYWRHNRIVWAAMSDCPDPLAGLAARLAAGLREIGVPLDDRPFVPHVTLLRNARRAPVAPAIAPVDWPVREFVLVESVLQEGRRVYNVMSRWRLGM